MHIDKVSVALSYSFRLELSHIHRKREKQIGGKR